jgi:hypothetical protein
MRSYPYLVLMERHGSWLSVIVALGVLLFGVALAPPGPHHWVGIAVSVAAAVLAWGFMRLLTDISRLLSETLIPRP